MKKIIHVISLTTLCLSMAYSYAADPKPAETKATTPAAATTTAAPTAVTPTAAATAEPAVKTSKSSICHDKSSPGYTQTKNCTEFKTMDECIKSGGRAPKGNK